MVSTSRPRAALALAAFVFTSSGTAALSAQEPAPRAAPARPGTGPAEERSVTPPALEIIPPRASSDTNVEYPEGGVGDAVVELELSISATGEVTKASVIAGDLPFAEAARAAAERWRFTPALRAGRPVPSRIRFRVGFEREVEARDAAMSEAAPAPSAALRHGDG
jgi:vitamin B12 transporter